MWSKGIVEAIKRLEEEAGYPIVIERISGHYIYTSWNSRYVFDNDGNILRHETDFPQMFF